jgi:hypothetical protein
MRRPLLAALLLAACANREEGAAPRATSPVVPEPSPATTREAEEKPADKPAQRPEKQVASGFDDNDRYGFAASGSGPGGGGTGLGTIGTGRYAGDDGKKGKLANEEEPAAPTRAWFPETFLFEPLVVTDGSGAATVPVKVPDRLTSWRVLALAHARNGAQAGTTHRFLGTLPAYVELVVPPFLVTGDELRLPVQVMNTTDKPLTAQLRIEAQGGALVGWAPHAVTVPAGGALVENVSLVVGKPGMLSVRAQLGSTDAVLRTVTVVPFGRPASLGRAGSLAAPRAFSIAGAADADPATSRVKVRIYPGALSLLRAELAATGGRGGVAEDAYTLLLAGRAPVLLTALGDKADPEALRQLALLGAQRAVRHARNLDITRATLLTEAALTHPDNPILSRLGERAAAWLSDHQRPDGTFSGETGWTLQRLLVTTAEAVRAVRSAKDTSDAARRRATRVSLAAQNAFERNAGRIEDPYTAAAILASGAAPDSLRPKLKKILVDAMETGADGTRTLVIPMAAVRPDGRRPSAAEASALAVLALIDDPDAKVLLADLGATLLGGYSPSWGWGDGRANLVALQAVVRLFRDPVPADVVIKVSLDGKEVASGKLSADKLKDVLTLVADVPNAAGAHEWQIAAEPPVPGLAYAFTLEQWIPWPKEARAGGLELSLAVPAEMKVGRSAEVTLRLAAPGNTPLVVVQALPAGAQPDTPTLQVLVDGGKLTSFDTADGSITMRLPPQAPGTVFTATFGVVPTLAGRLHASATTLETDPRGAETYYAAPPLWVIR